MVSLGIFYGVGSINEPPGMTGVSHWIEHLTFKGISHKDKSGIPQQIRRHGGILNGQTTVDYTYYFETLPQEHIDIALDIESYRMRNSCQERDGFERERQVILSELEAAENTHQYHLRRALQSTAYQVHPYRNPVIGWRHDLEHLQYEDLLAYYDNYYVPGNALVVVVGDINIQRILGKLDVTLGKIPQFKLPIKKRTSEPPQQGEKRIRIQQKGNAAYLNAAYHIPAMGHPDMYPLRILEAVLGFGRSGRLRQALVEKQLATAAWTSLFMPRDPGLMCLGATVPENSSTEKAENALMDEIHRIQQEGITEEELGKAIRQREMSFLYAQDSVSHQARLIGVYEMLGSYRYLEHYLSDLSQVTCDDVQRVAQSYLIPENCTIGWLLPSATTSHVQIPSHVQQPVTESNESHPLFPPSYGSMNHRKCIHHQLANGLKVVLQKSAASPIAEVRMRIRIGGNPEPTDLAGLSAFTSHLLQRGTKTRTSLDIAAEIEQFGASMQVYGNTDAISASLSALVKNLPDTLPVLADVLQNPVFPRQEFRKLRDDIRARLKEERDWPISAAYRAFYPMIYPKNHPYRYTMGLDQMSIENIRVGHLRGFHRDYYRPDCATLVLIGNVDVDETLELIETCFATWKSDGHIHSKQIPQVELQKCIQSTRIPIPDKSQVEVLIGHKGIARSNPDYYRLTLMNHLLSGFGGRFYQRIREELGLAYGVCSSFSAGLGEGPFLVHLGTQPQHVDIAVANILHEIRSLQKIPVDLEELADAKRSLAGNFALSLETHSGIASALLNIAFYGLEPEYIDNYATHYATITPDEIQDVAQRYLFPDCYSLAVAGPQIDEDVWQN